MRNLPTKMKEKKPLRTNYKIGIILNKLTSLKTKRYTNNYMFIMKNSGSCL